MSQYRLRRKMVLWADGQMNFTHPFEVPDGDVRIVYVDWDGECVDVFFLEPAPEGTQ